MDDGSRRFRIDRARSRRPRREFFSATEKAVDQSVDVAEITHPLMKSAERIPFPGRAPRGSRRGRFWPAYV